MKTLPLFYYPSTWIWVDDDHTLLRTMTETFSEQSAIKSFLSSQDCLNFLADYTSPLSKYNFIQSDLHDENYGLLTKNPMNFDVTQIAKLYEDKQRHNEATVIVIDYQMPVMNGLVLAEKIQSLPIQKILLTGNIQETKAVEGFNNNLIQKFIQKTSVNMYDNLSNYAKELSLFYFEQITKPLLSYLETENKTPLSDPVFIDFFENHCDKNKINEYYLIDKHGSFLCVDEHGARSFVVMHSSKSIEQWLSVYSDEKSLSKENVELIRKGKKIPFFGAGKEAWQISSDDWEKHLYNATPMIGREKYFFAVLNNKF